MSFSTGCSLCAYLQNSEHRDDLIEATESGDIYRIHSIAPKCTNYDIQKAMLLTTDYHIFVALDMYFSGGHRYGFFLGIFIKMMITGYSAEDSRVRASALAICSYIILHTGGDTLSRQLECTFYLGRFDMFEELIAHPRARDVIIDDYNHYYFLALWSKNADLRNYLEAIPLSEVKYVEETDLIFERCFWAAYHDDRETWLAEAKKLKTFGKDPHLYSWMDHIQQSENIISRPYFVADEWYFRQMFFDLGCEMSIGYYYGFSIEFKVEWMHEFLVKWFNLKCLVRPEDISYEYTAKWNGHGFDVVYTDNKIEREICSLELYIGCSKDEEQIKNELSDLEQKKQAIVSEKSFYIEVDPTAILLSEEISTQGSCIIS